jgi:hypothetical protein
LTSVKRADRRDDYRRCRAEQPQGRAYRSEPMMIDPADLYASIKTTIDDVRNEADRQLARWAERLAR